MTTQPDDPMEPRPPFFYFYEHRRDLWEELSLAALSFVLAKAVSASVGPFEPARVGLLAVGLVPFLSYAWIAIQSVRGSLGPQRWKSPQAKARHQLEELAHFGVRVFVAHYAGLQLAGHFGAHEGLAAQLLPLLIYALQAKAYHDMHVVQHLRGHALGPADRDLAARCRPLD